MLASLPLATAVPDPAQTGPRWGRRWVIVSTVLAACLSSGCMHRRFTIRSDPPGAAVLVDGEELDFTPCSLDYTYYGTREITLIKDGYKTLTLNQKLATPWYQVFPLEFVTDNLALTHLRDKREALYTLEPEEDVPTEALRDRANTLRSRALRSEMPGPGP